MRLQDIHSQPPSQMKRGNHVLPSPPSRITATATSDLCAQVGDFEVAIGGGFWVATGGLPFLEPNLTLSHPTRLSSGAGTNLAQFNRSRILIAKCCVLS